MVHTHDEAFLPYNENIHVSWPSWMNVRPLPDIVQQMPEWVVPAKEDSKGFRLEYKETSVHVPLRLARQLKLRGMNVAGEVSKCGVMELDE